MLYKLLILPIEVLYKYLYLFFYDVIGSYGISLILMSLTSSILIAPLMRWASTVQAKEQHLRDVMEPQIAMIKSESVGAQRHNRIAKLYSRYSYHPIYSIRSAIGVLLQVPFLMGAYYMLLHLSDIQAQSFGVISDLSHPDTLLMGMHLLPLVMTVINILAACTTPNFARRDVYQALVIAVLFLILLYNAPSALLIFWTSNNVWSLCVNLYLMRRSEKNGVTKEMIRRLSTNVPRFHITELSRFLGLIQVCVLLIAVQSALAFFASGYFDMLQGVIALFSSLILCLMAAYIAMHEGNGSRSFLRYSVVLIVFTFLVLVFLWGASSENIGKLLSHGSLPRWYILLGSTYRDALVRVHVHPSQIINLLFLFSGVFLLLYRRRAGFSWKMPMSSFWDYSKIVVGAALAAATFQACNNSDYLSLSMVLVYYFLVGLLSLIFYYIVYCIMKSRISEDDLSVSVAVFVFSLILNPSIHSVFKMYGATSLAFVILFIPLLFLVIVKQVDRKVLAAFLIVMTLLSVVKFLYKDVWGFGETDNVPIASTQREKNYIFKKNEVSINQQNRNSVFFLIFDGTPDMDTLRNLSIDIEPLSSVLLGNDFKIYKNTYSLFNSSINSMGTTYNVMGEMPRTSAELKGYCAGEGRVFRYFKNNGYKTCSIQDTYLTGGQMCVDEYFPPLTQYGSQVNALFVLLRGILAGEFRFDQMGVGSVGDAEYHTFLRETMATKKEPWFTVMHVDCPGHSQNSGKLLPNETELYVERLNAGIVEMKKDIKTILNNQPDAIIVILGDHGPYLTGDGIGLINYPLDEITELMIRDRFGTMIAIRWPEPERAAKYDRDLLVNQDIFPVIFAYLADSEMPLEYMLREKKARFKNHVFIDNGVFVPYTK